MVFVKGTDGSKRHIPGRDLLLAVSKIYEQFVNQYSIRVEDPTKPINDPQRFATKAPVSLSSFYLLKPAECKKPQRATGTLSHQ